MATPAIPHPTQNGQTASATPPDAHRPVQELHVRPDAVQRMIGAEGGFVGHYYNDQGGNCTVGAGHLVHMGPCAPADTRRTPTPEEMRQNLAADLHDAEDAVRRNVQRPLTQGQYDALVSLTYNAGPGGAQHLFRRINQVGPEDAASLIPTTAIHVAVRDPHNPHRITGHTISRGLQSRRQRELAVYQGR